MSFNLKFTKARERTPQNRADFAPVNIALVNDQWMSDAVAAPSKGRPTPTAEKFFEAFTDILAQVGKPLDHIAGHPPGCSVDQWRENCVRRGLVPREADRKREGDQKFSHYKLALIGLDKVVEKDGIVWPYK